MQLSWSYCYAQSRDSILSVVFSSGGIRADNWRYLQQYTYLINTRIYMFVLRSSTEANQLIWGNRRKSLIRLDYIADKIRLAGGLVLSITSWCAHANDDSLIQTDYLACAACRRTILTILLAKAEMRSPLICEFEELSDKIHLTEKHNFKKL